MTQQKRLSLYKSALWQYKLSLRFPFLKSILLTNYGFCLHFRSIGFIDELEELWSLRPESLYWFSPGEIEPRVKLLEQAIKMCYGNLEK